MCYVRNTSGHVVIWRHVVFTSSSSHQLLINGVIQVVHQLTQFGGAFKPRLQHQMQILSNSELRTTHRSLQDVQATYLLRLQNQRRFSVEPITYNRAYLRQWSGKQSKNRKSRVLFRFRKKTRKVLEFLSSESIKLQSP